MKTCVIMSTYNGQKYIGEQLDSIFCQKDCGDIFLYVRDDGSKDTTVDIIKNYSNEKSQPIIIDQACNAGASKSFLLALRECPEADYYAFCDQDDVWEAGKLEKAISDLQEIEGPALWISNYCVVDSELNVLSSDVIKNPCLDAKRVLFYNNVPGCVMVFNKQLLLEMRRMSVTEIRMHDIMALNIAILTGKVVFESKSYLKYRQHAANVIGYAHKKIKVGKWIKQKIALLRDKEKYDISEYAKEILNVFSEYLSAADKQEMELIATYKTSILKTMLLLSKGYTRGKFGRTSLSIRLRILFHIM